MLLNKVKTSKSKLLWSYEVADIASEPTALMRLGNFDTYKESSTRPIKVHLLSPQIV